MIGLAKRNILVFFRNKSTMFFSMLSPFIVIGLYVLVLRNGLSGGFGEIVPYEFMDNWIMAGLLAITTITATMGAYGIMVEDKSKKIIKDFYSSPIDRRKLVGGYAISSFAIGMILTLITFALAELYIVAGGGGFLSFSEILKALAVVSISGFCNTAIMLFMVSMLSSENAFAVASTIIGTLIGFLTGIYMPIGNLPAAVRWVVKAFPPSHSASLLRQIMMEKPLEAAFKNIPAEELEKTKETLGVVFKVGGNTIPQYVSIALLLVVGAVFFALSVLTISRKSR